LQLEPIGQIDLRQPFLLPQWKLHNPLRACGATRLGTVFDIVARQARAFDELRNKLALQIERLEFGKRRIKGLQIGGRGFGGPPKLSNCLGFSTHGVFTH
jgi:hypothetical protein